MKSGPKDELAADIGKRLRMRRLMLGMSQQTLASGIGVTFQQVQKYENGTNRVSASRMQQIASVLQIPVASLYENIELDVPVPAPATAVDLEAVLSTKDGVALIAAFAKLKDSKVRRGLVDLVTTLAAEHISQA